MFTRSLVCRTGGGELLYTTRVVSSVRWCLKAEVKFPDTAFERSAHEQCFLMFRQLVVLKLCSGTTLQTSTAFPWFREDNYFSHVFENIVGFLRQNNIHIIYEL